MAQVALGSGRYVSSVLSRSKRTVMAIAASVWCADKIGPLMTRIAVELSVGVGQRKTGTEVIERLVLSGQTGGGHQH